MKNMKMQYRGTIMVDIDGVLADFDGKFCEDFGTDNRHLFSLEKRYPKIDPELIKEYVKNPETYRDLEPIFGGLLFCRQASSRGWYILLVTSRDYSLKDITVRWLAKYGVPYNELIFSKNKRQTILDYDIMFPSRKVQIVVDDSVDVLKSLPEKKGIAWVQPWNFGGWGRGMYYDGNRMQLRMYDDGIDKHIWEKA